MFLQVAIRREGNNPWIVLKYNNFIRRLRVTTIKRGNVEKKKHIHERSFSPISMKFPLFYIEKKFPILYKIKFTFLKDQLLCNNKH